MAKRYIGRRYHFRFWGREHTLVCRGTTEHVGQLYLLFSGADGAASVTFEIALLRCTPDD